MNSRSLGHRAPLLWIALPLIAGLAVARLAQPDAVGVELGVAVAAAASALVGSAFDRARWLWPAGMVVALGCAGMASYTLHRRRIAVWNSLPPREARLSLRVQRLFAPGDPAKARGIGTITGAPGPLRELVGQRVYFACRQRPDRTTVQREAVIMLDGVVAAVPADPPGDSFDGYLASAGVNFRMARGWLVGEERPPPAYYRLCARAGVRFNAILGEGIERKRPELAGLLRAMMLGETSELTPGQRTLFMQSGTMHLFAISGLNIGVIAAAIEGLLALARLRPWARFVAGAPLLWMFVDITGAAPSAVRAFAMAVFFRAAFVARRPANALAAVVGSAAVVLVVAPLQVFSASFLMSYGIVLALLVLGLPLGEAWLQRAALWRDVPRVTWNRLQRRLDQAWCWLLAAIAVGVAATLVSLLTGVQFFGLITPGALLANLALVPAAVFVTIAGFGSLLSGLLGLTGDAILFNHAAALILLVIEQLVRWSVRVPWAYLPAHFRAPWIGGVALSALMASLLVGYGAGWQRRGGWWPPFVVVGLTLVLGVTYG